MGGIRFEKADRRLERRCLQCVLYPCASARGQGRGDTKHMRMRMTTLSVGVGLDRVVGNASLRARV